MQRPHYVYELRRETPGAGPILYIGVRTAPKGDPECDDYWGSSQQINDALAIGARFSKRILKTFETRADAEFYEADLHWRHMVGKDPQYYNRICQLIEGRLDELVPRSRFISPDGQHLWFVPGSEPAGWSPDPARWAQYKDTGCNNDMRTGFRYTFEGMQPPEWQFHKYYPDELAFGEDSELHGYRPYIRLGEDQTISGFSYFPENYQPLDWIDGIPAYRVADGIKPPFDWLECRWIADPEKEFFQPNVHERAYFPPQHLPQGWIIADRYQQWRQEITDRKVYFRNELYEELRKLESIFKLSSDGQLTRRLREFRKKRYQEDKAHEWVAAIAGSTKLSGEEKEIAVKFLTGLPSEILHASLDDVVIKHVSEMLSEATRIYESANDILKLAPATLPRLIECRRLLGDVEVLISDTLSHIDSDQLKMNLAELHRQQGKIDTLIIQQRSNEKGSFLFYWILAIFVFLFILFISS